MGRHTDAYFRALRSENRAFWENAGGAARADTLFFGGGTPSSVHPDYICNLMPEIPREANAEVTIEANPGTLGPDKLAAYAAAGINRLSMGLQSSHEGHLRMLGRIHTFEGFRKNYHSARDAGFINISADLLFGLPCQTMAQWEATLEAVASLGIRHLSCYSLSLEEGTPLHEAVSDGSLPYPDEDLDREMYAFAISYLRSAGIYQYELSNFAEPGRECRHNLKYWTGAKYIGFGAGAHSYDGAIRFSNVKTIEGYISAIGAGGADVNNCRGGPAWPPSCTEARWCAPQGLPCGGAVAECTGIDAAEREKEYIILRLRLNEGFCDADFAAEFRHSFIEKYKAVIEKLISEGLIEIGRGGHMRLTPKGMDLANRVFTHFV